MSETNYDDIPCTCGVGNVFHAPFHHAWCPCHTQGSQPPPSEVERLRAENAALAQRLADVAYLAEWQRAAPLTREIMCRADGAFNAMEATGGPTDAYRIVACAADLPALGARLRALSEEAGR